MRTHRTLLPRGRITALGAAYRNGAITPSEEVERCLALATAGDGLRAWSSLHPDAARRDAAAMTREMQAGRCRGPLHGVPFGVKDVIDVAGIPTTSGCGGSPGPAEETADIVRRLQTAGAVVLGKTATAALAANATGINRTLGTPTNHWQSDLAPGGSSSGSAVAVAAGHAPFALGTDCGGSVRIPAAWCGVVGFKPSRDAHAWADRSGVVPLSHSLDSIGAICGSVADAMLLHSELADGQMGRRNGDLFAPPSGLDGLRCGVLAPAQREAVEPAVLRRYDDTLKVLQDVGVHLVPFDLPRQRAHVWPGDTARWTITEYAEHATTIVLREGYEAHAALVDDSASRLDETTRRGLALGSARYTPDSKYQLAQSARAEASSTFAAAFHARRLSAYISPTTPMPPPTLEALVREREPATIAAAAARTLLDACWRGVGAPSPHPPTVGGITHFTAPSNFLGLCAITVSYIAHRDDAAGDDLPGALHIAGLAGMERTILWLAAGLEPHLDGRRTFR